MAAKKEPDFAEKFWPQDNPFKITIAKILPPKMTDGSAPPDAFLIKVKALVSLPMNGPEDSVTFQKLIKALEVKKSFCGIWTPEFSEPYFDSGESSVELTSYLRQGHEDKILHLDHVARASTEKKEPSESEDDVLVDTFLTQLRKGSKLKDAMSAAEKETRDIMSRGRKAELEIESDGLDRPVRLDSQPPLTAHKPPPGPGLQKGAPPPGPPAIRGPEGAAPKNELSDAVNLTSKDRDAELDSGDAEGGIDIHKKKQPDDRKPGPVPHKPDSGISAKDISAIIERYDDPDVEMNKKKNVKKP